jgi:hypothetical protein
MIEFLASIQEALCSIPSPAKEKRKERERERERENMQPGSSQIGVHCTDKKQSPRYIAGIPPCPAFGCVNQCGFAKP